MRVTIINTSITIIITIIIIIIIIQGLDAREGRHRTEARGHHAGRCYTMICYSILIWFVYYNILWYDMLHYTMLCDAMIWYTIPQHNIASYNILHYNLLYHELFVWPRNSTTIQTYNTKSTKTTTRNITRQNLQITYNTNINTTNVLSDRSTMQLI